MSQAKVDARKENKKNRKKIMAREKRIRALEKLIAYVCIIALAIGIGWSVYRIAVPKPEYDISSFYNLISTDSYGILSPTLPE